MTSAYSLRVLGLSKNEAIILRNISNVPITPRELHEKTHLSRPTVYDTLRSLKHRGLVKFRVQSGKTWWELASQQKIFERLEQAHQHITMRTRQKRQIKRHSGTQIFIHRGATSVKQVMSRIFFYQRQKRWQGLQGHVAQSGWNEVFSASETNTHNTYTKKNNHIIEAILPERWYERSFAELGIEWAKSTEGRKRQVHYIPEHYFQHAAHLILFDDSVYLIALKELLVIEIKNTDIQKMIASLYMFVKDNSPSVDANEIIRNLIRRHQQG